MRPIYEIAREIEKDWKKMSVHAKPYLHAMKQINSINDMYFMDSGRRIILYFLSNAGTWKGETARRIKLELNQMVRLQRNKND
jgi:hypothetical protein